MNEMELERMIVRILADATGYKKGIKEVEAATRDVSNKVEQSSKKMEVFGATIDNLGTKMSSMAGQFRAMAAIGSPFETLKESVRKAAEKETIQINLGTLLKSDDLGLKLTEQLKKFAAETPMNMPGIMQATKLLLSFGETADSVIPLMKMLGDAALGDNEKFQRLALAYGQMSRAGHVTNEELNQMREAGFSPLDEMAKILKKDVGVLKDEIAKGNVPFSVFTKALKNMTSAGGQFDDGMKKASRGLEGLLSTMKDDIDTTKESIGVLVIEATHLKEVVAFVSSQAQGLTERFEKMDKGTRELIGTLVVIAASFGALILTWKIGAIAVGMIVGVLSDMVVSFGAVGKGLAALNVALTTTHYQVVAVNGAMKVVAATNWLAVAAVGATTLALVGLAAVALNWALGGSKAAHDFNLELKIGRDLMKEMADLQAKRTTKEIAAVTDNPLISPEQKKAELEKILKGVNTQIADTEKNLHAAEAEANRYDTTLKDIAVQGRKALSVFGVGFISPREANFEEEKARVTDQQILLEGLKKTKKELDDQLKTVIPALDPKVKTDLQEFTLKLSQAGQTMGMTTDQAKLYEFQLKKMPESMMANARGLIAMNEELKKTQEATKAFNDMKLKLDEEAMSFGKTKDEIELHKLALKGLNAEQLREIESLQATTTALQKTEDMRKEAASITKEFMTPLEKMRERISELTDMYNAGAISTFTFNAATKDARTKFDEATNGAHKLNAELQKLDATTARSADAMFRIQSFREGLSISSPRNDITGKVAVNVQQKSADKQAATVNVLEEIKSILEKTADNTLTVVAAGLGTL